jgi:GNAT superfamily N-acetyltransferase
LSIEKVWSILAMAKVCQTCSCDHRPMAEILTFAPQHLDGVIDLCVRQDWATLVADPARTLRAFSAPGAVSLVAVEEEEAVGFAQALTDGHIQAYLCRLLVAEAHRKRGIGRLLVQEVMARSGALRLDLLGAEGTHSFYASFAGWETWSGYRLPVTDL